MNPVSAMEHATKLVPAAYVAQAQSADNARANRTRQLLQQRKLPERGWTEHQIEMLLMELSLMDSNNFLGNCGVGEREGRVFSGLVYRRHYRLSHGIGRSGDVTEPQPKAAGSSIISQLTNQLTADALRLAGLKTFCSCFVVPMATGMTLSLCFLTLRHSRPNARYIIWPRIDQKSCFKSIHTSGFEAVVIENTLCGDELRTDMTAVKSAVERLGADNILCIFTTTSCFAPRAIDRLTDVAELCRDQGIPHVVNNAYGVQSSKCTHEINQAARIGRVDVVVQSTDKNFMVPVGGAVVIAWNRELGRAVRQNYPGRGSMAPTLDLFITLLAMGASGWRQCLRERRRLFDSLREQLGVLARRYGLRVLNTPNNPISIAITLPSGCTDSPIVTADSTEVPDSPRVAEVSDSTNSAEVPDVADLPDSPDSTGVPDSPGSTRVPDSAEVLDSPDAADFPDSPDVADFPDSSDVADFPDSPNSAEVPDSPDGPDSPDLADAETIADGVLINGIVSKMSPDRLAAVPCTDVSPTDNEKSPDDHEHSTADREHPSADIESTSGANDDRADAEAASGDVAPLPATSQVTPAGDSANAAGQRERVSVTQVGSMLFTRLVSGSRALSTDDVRTVVNHQFQGWGCHYDNYPYPYLTAAASVGMTDADISMFIERLDRVLHKFTQCII